MFSQNCMLPSVSLLSGNGQFRVHPSICDYILIHLLLDTSFQKSTQIKDSYQFCRSHSSGCDLHRSAGTAGIFLFLDMGGSRFTKSSVNWCSWILRQSWRDHLVAHHQTAVLWQVFTRVFPPSSSWLGDLSFQGVVFMELLNFQCAPSFKSSSIFFFALSLAFWFQTKANTSLKNCNTCFCDIWNITANMFTDLSSGDKFYGFLRGIPGSIWCLLSNVIFKWFCNFLITNNQSLQGRILYSCMLDLH